MLSLFDRVDGYPAVEDDQRHVNLVLCPQRLRRLLERCPVSTLESLRGGLCLRNGRAADAGGRQRSISDQRNGCAASSKVAQMPTIEITEPKGLGPRWIRSLLSCRTLSFPTTYRFIPAQPPITPLYCRPGLEAWMVSASEFDIGGAPFPRPPSLGAGTRARKIFTRGIP
jgi:hypothetical protein